MRGEPDLVVLFTIICSILFLSLLIRIIIRKLIKKEKINLKNNDLKTITILLLFEFSKIVFNIALVSFISALVILAIRQYVKGVTFVFFEDTVISLFLFGSFLYSLYKHKTNSLIIYYVSVLVNILLIFNLLRAIPNNDISAYAPALFLISVIQGIVSAFNMYKNMQKIENKINLKSQKSISSLFTSLGTFAGLCWGFLSFFDPNHGKMNIEFYSWVMILLFSIYPIHIGILMTDMLNETKLFDNVRKSHQERKNALREIKSKWVTKHRYTRKE